ncbi:MAG: NAD(P)/FAD-dependent oxidoreductase [Hyphomicrobium zavarzinii]|jgi:NADH dehydrogenase|uniref:NAD(P)/FAD-dependent oxidoreductase n=1 Tax=Hyphomicrobium TaxID=81 RepID=UPI00036D0B85|nr:MULTISPECIES: NAD(P)/FAD-dependent oxidoreductase [Hyphomicrobium]MBL8846922.1 NAD(P)/FAD-dependent oxidoreductase [Hyphomicrobium zavarzinii]WBT38939.1 NAD(P)/FAD-dependent oxidoreductase [Hyphomicrobium sp. DMF-1]HML44754.1 NAD(P)/FAD-dependent oxidoreductase [Hyphomicrobium zavarzinii]
MVADVGTDTSKPLVLPKPDLHHIIVVGGGAGGLELATRLGDKLGRRKKAAITLVDRSRTHIWKPLLHEIAAGSMDVDRHEVEYMAQGHWHGFKFRYGEMIGLDRARKLIHLARTVDEDGREITPDRWLPYDTLIIAVGSVSNDFGVPGVKQNAMMLDTPEQAERFNRRLINACVRANTQPGPIRPEQLHVAIIGAGATGTELSAELHGTARGVVAFGLDKIDPEKDIRITLIEANDRIVPALPPRISQATAEILTGLNVDIRTSARVTEVTEHGVKLASGDFIPSELVVWAAGVKGPDVLSNLDGLEVSRSNQLIVKPTLETTFDPNIFAFGDCAYLVPPGETLAIPPRAQAAHQEASHLVKQLKARLNGEPLKPFVYRDFGSLVSLGDYSTVGSLMGFVTGRKMLIEGFVAKLMYRSLYKMHETALHGYWKVMLDSISRLLTRRTEPHVKLH